LAFAGWLNESFGLIDVEGILFLLLGLCAAGDPSARWKKRGRSRWTPCRMGASSVRDCVVVEVVGRSWLLHRAA